MSADPSDVVRRGYDVVGEAYHAWSHANPVRLGFVQRVLDRLPAGSRVVDLGCGTGDPTVRLLAERHRVVGIDLSLAQVRRARLAVPSASFVAADITSFALRPGSVDAIVSLYALVHIPADRHRPLLEALATWLRPGGLALVNAPLTIEDGAQEQWLGVPMYFGGIGEQATLRAVRDAGLHVESAERVSEDEGDGKAAEFLWVTAVKPAG